MKYWDKIKAGLLLVRRTPGLRSKISVLKQLALVAHHSRLSGSVNKITDETVAANAWADYYLLSFVNRDVNVRIVPENGFRAWFLLPELNSSVIFGGYIALFQFMNFMQSKGYPTGVIVLNPLGDMVDLMKSFESSALVHNVLSRSEIGGFGTARTIRLGPKDMIVSYNWTTSLVAAKMAGFLDDQAYYYFVQEDERIFYSNDSHRFLAESVFHRHPRPRMICNSSKLLEYFRAENLVYPDTIVGVFEQGLPPAVLPDRDTLNSRSPRRFVFYGRPEEHAKRNLMSIALMAITKAKRDGAFNKEPWEFFMIGSAKMGESFDLDGMRITCLPNQDYDAYRQTLASFDMGMALMYAPHPSVPPFEMVRSGVVTVVNTTRMRPAEWYQSISANFEPGEPSVRGLAAAIVRASARVSDSDSRLASAATYHPESWEESFAGLPSVLGHAIFNQMQKEPTA